MVGRDREGRCSRGIALDASRKKKEKEEIVSNQSSSNKEAKEKIYTLSPKSAKSDASTVRSRGMRWGVSRLCVETKRQEGFGSATLRRRIAYPRDKKKLTLSVKVNLKSSLHPKRKEQRRKESRVAVSSSLPLPLPPSPKLTKTPLPPLLPKP